MQRFVDGGFHAVGEKALTETQNLRVARAPRDLNIPLWFAPNAGNHSFDGSAL